MVNAALTVPNQPTRTYPNPPVHEVVVDLVFLQELGEDRVREFAQTLKGKFQLDEVHEIKSTELLMSVGPSEHQHRMQTQFEGWSFRSAQPGWNLNVQRKQLTLHVVRPGKWPKGPYVGWTNIISRFAEIHEALEPTYGGLDLKRAGLRYLNRLAVPVGSDLDDWFTLRFQSPEVLDGLYTFDHKQTWATTGSDHDVGTTVRLAKITIEDEGIAEGHVGVLLDIDMFNLFVKDAPDYDEALQWLERAHTAENTIFEASVTDLAKESFNVTA